MKSIIILLGTKAQFVKLAPVLLELDRVAAEYHLVYTGQHNETFLELQHAFGTRDPDYCMCPAMEASTRLRFLKWCLVFWRAALSAEYRKLWRSSHTMAVHGDTMSTLFGALVGRIFGLQVAHIEAGLRSPKLFNPFPEEIIRRIVSRLTRVHFCPDDWSAANISTMKGQIHRTGGNTLLDSLSLALQRANVSESADKEENFAVVSMHRVENLSNVDTLNQILETLLRVSEFISLEFVLHPATRETLARTGWMAKLEGVKGIRLRPRTDYFSFVQLLLGCNFLMTDGGSNQEEATMLGLPCLLLRKCTERQDGLGANVVLSDLDPVRILEFAQHHARRKWVIKQLPAISPSKMIVNTLLTPDAAPV